MTSLFKILAALGKQTPCNFTKRKYCRTKQFINKFIIMVEAKFYFVFPYKDRHLEKRAQQVAFFWEGNDPKDSGQITYGELHKDVCKFANVLRAKGVKKVCVFTNRK